MRFAELDKDGWQLCCAETHADHARPLDADTTLPPGSLCRLLFAIGFADPFGRTSLHHQPLWVSVRRPLPQGAYLGCLVEAPFLFANADDDDLRPGLDLPFKASHILDLVLPQHIAPAEQALIAALPHHRWLPRAA